MSPAKADGAPSRKLVDALAARPDLGATTAVLATTFDLDPDFFESDFLPSLLGIPASEDRRWRTRVQLESELARVDSVSVLMEATRWAGRPRTLRVHVQPARAQDRNVLHAKILLVVHEDAVRLLVGSANLTKHGYRANREVALSLVATKKTRENGALIRQALKGIEKRLQPWWTPSADTVVKAARVELDRLDAPDGLDDDRFVWGGDEEPLFRQIVGEWPENEAVRQIRIVSPFWSHETGSGPLARLLEGLSARGAKTKGAEVLLVTSAKPDGTATWRPALPETYATFDFLTLGVRASAVPAKLAVDAEDVGRDDVLVRRELHAKVVFIEGPKTTVAYAGSANFTFPGWGFGTPTGANIEAGVLMRRQGKARASLDGLMPPMEGEPVRLEGTGRAITVVPPEVEAPRPWPTFIHSVELRPAVAEAERLELVIDLAPGQPPQVWSVAIGPDGPSRQTSSASVKPSEHRMPLEPDDVRTLVELQAVQIRWDGGPEGGISYPVNASLTARERLPFGDPSRLPSEADLVAFYQGRIALEDLFPPPPGESEGETPVSVEATESAVDTSKILSYQVRAFVEALTGLRDEIQRNTATERSMRLAVLGPVSPVALSREIGRAAAQGRSPLAAGFQLVELVGVLRAARSFPVDARVASAWVNVLDEGEAEITKRLTELRQAHAALGVTTSFGAYMKTALTSAGETP